MAEDPNVVSKTALLQSITTEANGFYTQIVTVASAFLGGSLLFIEKIAPVRTVPSVTLLAIGWTALVISIGCVVRLRHLNLIAGGRAMDGEYDHARKLNRSTDRLSAWSQWTLLIGMMALAAVGVVNVAESEDGRDNAMSKDKGLERAVRPHSWEEKTIPYGSTGPKVPQSPPAGTQTPNTPKPQPTTPNQGGANK